MTSSHTNPFEVKVLEYNPQTACATAIDSTEIDDIIHYDIFVPSYFGGSTAPYPKVGDKLMIVYDKWRKLITNAWHPASIAA
jgi:hypothetical protein